MLLGRKEVNPDMPDIFGKTPLSHVACIGHEGVVKILLRREEVNPEKLDIFGLTPLSRAAENGHKTIVALLQSHKAFSPPYGLGTKKRRLV